MGTRRHFPFSLYVVIILGVVMSGCGGFRHAVILITNPHDNDTFALGDGVNVHISASSSLPANHGSWESYEYEVRDNDRLIGHGLRIPFTQTEATVVENALPGGLHLITARARGIRRDYDTTASTPQYIYGDWYNSNEVCVWFGPNAPADFCTIRTIGQPVEVAPTATHTPFPPTPVPVIDSVQAFPNPIYYGATCPNLSTVTFRAALTMPAGITADMVQVQAHVNAEIGSVQSNSGSLLVPLLATQTWDTATGGQVFSGTLDLSHSYNDASNHLDLGSLGGNSGALLWYADASSHDAAGMNATFLGRSGNQVIDLAPCPTASQNRPHNNGSGSGSTSGGSSGGTGCEQYSNQLSCNLAGCSWNPQSSACSVTP